MEAKDLMIGDLVYNHRNWICPIVEIHKDSAVVIARHYGEEEFRLDDLRPIPLTSEILEKNGFSNNGSLWYLEEDNFELEHNNNDSFIWIVGDVYIVAIIKYVHQLQQALRLSKIRKEIDYGTVY